MGLNSANYTLLNALTWGNFSNHWQEACQGSWKSRVVHLTIATAEFFPGISQVVSLVELMLAKPNMYINSYFNSNVSTVPTRETSPADTRETSPADTDLINFFSRISVSFRPVFKGNEVEQASEIRNWIEGQQKQVKEAREKEGGRLDMVRCCQVNILNIQNLDLKKLNFTKLSPEISQFCNLKNIELGNNKIASLANVTFPDSLQQIFLNNNKITSLASVTFPNSLQWLILSNNQIDIASLAKTNFPNSLISLCLSNNQISSLADVLFPSSLRELNLENNEIASLANVTFSNPLRWLNLSNNKIDVTSLEKTSFPSSLKKLLLKDNKIASLADVTFPSSLEELNLENNKIASLADVTFPSSLRELNLENNKLKSLPDSILNLPYNCIVKVKQNQFTTISYEEFQNRLNKQRAEHPTLGPCVEIS